jgi:excinuclease ABC subunit A
MDKNFQGIVVRGARDHNLKNVDIEIPRNKLTVITGLSGSGKSTIAFDTIYAEGQRRYIESLSAYARNFMEQLEKPQVDSITGLSPSIAIDQKSLSTNPRSTVGTVTEIYDFLRLLYARIGIPHCPEHNVPVQANKPDQIVSDIISLPAGTKYQILAPVAVGEKGEFHREFAKWQKKGFVRAKVDGVWLDLEKAPRQEKHKRHDIDLLVDKLINEEKYIPRLRESINRAISITSGTVTVEVVGREPKTYSIHRACPICQFSFPELEPRLFSFNNPRGACPTCSGMGIIGFDENAPEKRGRKSEEDDDSDDVSYETCPDCKGKRLKKSSLNVFINEKNIAELSSLAAEDLAQFLESLKWDEREKLIGEKIVGQIQYRLKYMIRVGTGYLSLERQTRTLSGGEVQRIRLATQVGSSLVGILYVLDEPSIGLHPRDHHRLLGILKELRDRGNTVLLVEHDEETIRAADYVVDLGPRAGRLGGEIMARGTPDEIAKNPNSLTGKYLRGDITTPVPKKRRAGNGQFLSILGASGNNLKNVDMHIPLGTLCGVTGVSGSGKSTLVIDTLYRALAQYFYKASYPVAPLKKIEGLEHIDRVIQINQKPIGRSPRSTPSTYIGLYSLIRDLYTRLPESKIRGYKPGQFSFNVKGGRCEACEGGGVKKVAMHFLSDVYVTCDTCHGMRYNPETRSIKFKEKSIADVLQMTVDEALTFFQNQPLLYRKLETLKKVGLDYLTLGQNSTTLSGGEAQRIKLSKELSKRGTGKTLFILDEPTTGLHFEDIRKLTELLQTLVDQGNTVLVIEHNMDVIKTCDHVIDLGPDGGRHGGDIVAHGTPEQVSRAKNSETGPYLKDALR